MPWDVLPPLTLVGFSVSDESVTAVAGVMVSVAWCELLPNVAVITAVVTLVTVGVVTPKDAVVVPAGTVTPAGTLAAPLLLESVTTTPPEPAGPDRVTVP